jgi:RNA polymerase sigma factor for flagellar operon FliA
LLGGAVLIEHVFAWPGIGGLAFDAVADWDMPVVNGCIVLFGTLFVTVNALDDLLCALVAGEVSNHGSERREDMESARLNVSENSRAYIIAGTSYTREEVIHRYLHLVKYVAGRISVNLPPNVELNDLINDGVLGLIDAIEKYDDSRGVKFETYAITRINGAIIDALRALDWVPRAVRQRAREIDRVTQELEAKLGRMPTDNEMAQQMSIGVREYLGLVRKIRNSSVASLEEHLPSDRGSEIPLMDTLRDVDADVSLSVEQREVRRHLIEAIETLPQQERTVIKLYYFDGQTLKEIKSSLGVSESRVSQIHAQAVIHLRTKLRELRDDFGFRDDDPDVKKKYVRRPAAAAPPEIDSSSSNPSDLN